MKKYVTPIELFQDDEFLNSVAIEPPMVFKTAMRLKEEGLAIDLKQIVDISSLAKEIARVKELAK